MRITTITIHKSLTINVGDYQNEKVDVSMTAELGDGDLPGFVAASLGAQVDLALAAEAQAIVNEQPRYRAQYWRDRLGIQPPPEPERAIVNDDEQDEDESYEFDDHDDGPLDNGTSPVDDEESGLELDERGPDDVDETLAEETRSADDALAGS